MRALSGKDPPVEHETAIASGPGQATVARPDRLGPDTELAYALRCQVKHIHSRPPGAVGPTVPPAEATYKRKRTAGFVMDAIMAAHAERNEPENHK